jgi:hypothetical protein
MQIPQPLHFSSSIRITFLTVLMVILCFLPVLFVRLVFAPHYLLPAFFTKALPRRSAP